MNSNLGLSFCETLPLICIINKNALMKFFQVWVLGCVFCSLKTRVSIFLDQKLCPNQLFVEKIQRIYIILWNFVRKLILLRKCSYFFFCLSSLTPRCDLWIISGPGFSRRYCFALILLLRVDMHYFISKLTAALYRIFGLFISM